MNDKRPLLFLLALLLVVGGAVYLRDSGGDSAAPSNATAPQGGTAATTTTVVASVDTTPTTEAGASSAQFNASITKLTAAENQLFRSPDPSKVADIMTASCSCNADTTNRITQLKQKGLHLNGDSLKVTKVIYISGSGNSMKGYATVGSGGGAVVDSDNKTIEPADAGAFQPLVYTLERGQDGLWRVADRRLPTEVVNPG